LEDYQIADIAGMEYNGQFGMGTLDRARDLDGNGTADLIFGDMGYDEDEDDPEGAVYMIYQPL
jgi:hypothetical protein